MVQIGEYVGRLSDEFRQQHNNIPLKEIKDMRNFAAHQYEHFDFKILWHTITVELGIKRNVKSINLTITIYS